MNKAVYFIFLIIILIATSCHRSHTEATSEADAVIDTIPQLITHIQQCSRLYTTEFVVHKIVTYDDVVRLKGSLFSQQYNFRLPIGDRKVAIPMDATLKAYIDFSDFSAQSVERNGQKITITLPPPRVVMTASKIDQKQVKEYVALTRAHFSDQELSLYEQQGREAILRSIPNMGIIEQARLSAARLLIPIVSQMGFRQEDITIVFPNNFDPYNLKRLIDTNSIER